MPGAGPESGESRRRPGEESELPAEGGRTVVLPLPEASAEELHSPSAASPRLLVGLGVAEDELEPLRRFFAAVPAGSGMAFLVAVHPAAGGEAGAEERLGRLTEMPVMSVATGMELCADTVYVQPAGQVATLTGGRFALRAARVPSPPVDALFQALAEGGSGPLAAVVLTGTRRYGWRGLTAVKDAGGLCIAQAPARAGSAGAVDWVLPPERMPVALLRHAGGASCDAGDARGSEAPAPVMQGILSVLRATCGVDFSRYKRATVERRIARRMEVHGIQTIADYLQRVRADRAEVDALHRDLLIGVTWFFRDPAAFEVLQRKVVTELIQRRRPGQPIRIWVAGCSTGEEAYSLAILFHEQAWQIGEPCDVKIFATDVHRAALEIASCGRYPARALAHVSESRRRCYFRSEGGDYEVREELRRMVVFAPHDLLRDAPFTHVDMVSCRNVLIRLDPAAQGRVLRMLHYGLEVGGFLLLGSGETPSELTSEFEVVDAQWKAYRKVRATRPALDLPSLPPRRAPRVPTSTGGLMDAYDELLDRFIPAGFLVDESRTLVHSFGGAARYLRPRQGRSSLDLLDLLDPELRPLVAVALRRVARERQAVVLEPVTVGRDPLPSGFA